MQLESILDTTGIKSQDKALLHWTSTVECYALVTLDSVTIEPSHEKELQNFIETLQRPVVVTRSQEHTEAVARLRATADNNQPFIGFCLNSLSAPPLGWTSFLDITSMSFPNKIEVQPPVDNPDQMALIMFTSRISGTLKGVPRSVGEVLHILASADFISPVQGLWRLRHDRGVSYDRLVRGHTSPETSKIPVYKGVVAFGVILLGTKIRIVNDDGHAVGWNRCGGWNQPGVLHLSGYNIAKVYLGGLKPKAIYESDSSRWFIMGDYAMQDNHSHVFVMG
ncbi:hypothetical protein EMCG_07902 [[Emmonsia] crescens]|uniref:AMP-dependent synthetase/ligase domain-containing protein n=1 Tax=[Emmonsia] crescens TaxID=73230 RepID=A0A0G2I7E6_9EURO|nr:hypothetical protein EMCG_07902 [Emmonsia crescens UAMH 3008]